MDLKLSNKKSDKKHLGCSQKNGGRTALTNVSHLELTDVNQSEETDGAEQTIKVELQDATEVFISEVERKS